MYSNTDDGRTRAGECFDRARHSLTEILNSGDAPELEHRIKDTIEAIDLNTTTLLNRQGSPPEDADP